MHVYACVVFMYVPVWYVGKGDLPPHSHTRTQTHTLKSHTSITLALYTKPAVKASPAPVASTTSTLNTGTKPVCSPLVERQQ